jgi:S1-C subfamily serine protease
MILFRQSLVSLFVAGLGLVGLSLVATSLPAGPAGKASTSASASTSATSGLDRARVATVVLTRKKAPIGLGVYLSEKAVILTARSPIISGGDVSDVEVTFPETGTTTKVKLHYEDAAWDLALLVPFGARGNEGALPAATDPLAPSAVITSFALLKTGHLSPQSTPVLGKREYQSTNGDVLKDALAIDAKAASIGSPLVDSDGGVVAIVTRACAPTATPAANNCPPTLIGAPMQQLRSFLLKAPPIVRPTPYMGVVVGHDRFGVRVIEIQEGSPAETAGLVAGEPSVGDVIVAIDGNVVKNQNDLQEQINKHDIGQAIKVTVVRAGKLKDVDVKLGDTSNPKPAHAGSTPPPSAIAIPVPR